MPRDTKDRKSTRRRLAWKNSNLFIIWNGSGAYYMVSHYTDGIRFVNWFVRYNDGYIGYFVYYSEYQDFKREGISNLIYLRTFQLSKTQVKNPNIYPYSVFKDKYIEPFVFDPITIFYGNNGSGKSTLLNIIADKLQIKGREHATSNSFGIVDYCDKFVAECSFAYGEDEFGFEISRMPENSRYIKSEDVLYEIKKIQQNDVLSEGMLYDLIRSGKTLKEARKFLASKEGNNQKAYIEFAQEKYSNGETAMQYFNQYLQPDALYLLDEPEVSLSPANQVRLADEINKMTRLLGCQFMIATHSPFMLGTLHAKIYDIDSKEYDVVKWSKLENVRYFYDFFKKHEDEFE